MARPGIELPPWLAALQTWSNRPPVRSREALVIGEAQVGSLVPEVAHLLAAHGWIDKGGSTRWHLVGSDPSATLASVAGWLHDHGMAGKWRGEQLAVTDHAGFVRATVERAAVRPLGIVTFSVHLVGQTSDGRVWLQQRALDKATDPGKWDTLMGGMVSAGETTAVALERETWEEAGLRIEALGGVRVGGRISMRRPVDGSGAGGYLIEHCTWHAGDVPDGLVPANQDGEVERFELVAPEEALARAAAGQCSPEAALVLADALLGNRASGS